MRFRAGIWRSLAAVVIGNALYFFALLPHLPAQARHTAFRLDLGLIIDFWICLLVWGAITLAVQRWPRRR